MSYYAKMLERISADPLQKTAYDTEDSTVVIAGPGSGKTTILTLKIMKLLNNHITEPQGLACLTFSKEAAREFEDRLKKLGYAERRNVFLGTVHSFCISEILSNFAELYDYGVTLPIKVLPKKLEKQIYNSVLNDLGIKKKIKKEAIDKERALHIQGVSKVPVASDATAHAIAVEYEKRVLSAGYIDYQGIIILSTKILQEHEYVRKCISAKYPWLVIDEYQDLGKPLHEMVMSLFTKTDIKIFAVGDPDQSIYGFSGAIPDYLMELYNREDTISVELKNNYRSNQDIIDGSEIVLNLPRHYHAMTREDEEAEYRFISCNNGLEEQFDFFAKKIVVSQYDEILEDLGREGFETVKNNQSALGISHSVHLALEQITEHYAVCFSVSDQPWLTRETIRGLVTAFRKNTRGMVCASWEGMDGNPVIFAPEYRKELLALSGDVGGRKVLLAHPEDVARFVAGSSRELADVDEKSQLCYNQND